MGEEMVIDEIILEGSSGSNGKIYKNNTYGRDELAIYAGGDAYDRNSRGAGIHLYGNEDNRHDGNIAFLTGINNHGDGRMIISGYSDQTRITMGNNIWNYVDNHNDTALLTLKNPKGIPALYIENANGLTEGDIAVKEGEALTVGIWNGNTFSPKVGMDAGGDWIPYIDGAVNLGDSNNRWKTIYSRTGIVSTSDAREKKDISPINKDERKAALAIKKIISTFRFKGDSKIHIGVMAQEVEKIMEENNLDANDYAFFLNEKDTYGIRYEELLCFIVAAI